MGTVPPPSAGPEDWATPPSATVPGGTGQQVPAGGVSPMLPPPMLPPTGAGAQGGAERPDSSGLLGGEQASWMPGASDPGTIGAFNGLVPPSPKPEEWATSQPEVPVSAEAGQSVTPEVPMTPPADTTPADTTPADTTPAALPAEWAVTPDVVGSDSEVLGDVVDQPSAVDEQPEVLAPQSGDTTPEPVAEVELTPAAAPAGWAASSPEVVPHEPGVSPSVVGAAVVGASALTAFAAATPAISAAPAAPAGPIAPGTNGSAAGTPGHGVDPFPDFNDEERDEDHAGGPAIGLTGGEHGPVRGIDSVVVVRVEDAVEDTSAWDTGAQDFLPGLLLPFTVPKANKGWDSEEPNVDLTLRSTEPWEPEPGTEAPVAEYATYRRKKFGEAAPIVEWAPIGCGDEMTVPPDEREEFLSSLEESEEDEDESDEEPEERSMADLLNQDGSAWGSKPSSKPMGILE
jgi:hypothetical protein